jgi:hypothetical protein
MPDHQMAGEDFLYIFKARHGARRFRLRLRADPGRAELKVP